MARRGCAGRGRDRDVAEGLYGDLRQRGVMRRHEG